MIEEERKRELTKLARQREAEIIDAWWHCTPDIWEYQEEHDLTDNELTYLLEEA